MIGRVRRIGATAAARACGALALFAARLRERAVSAVDDAGARVELAQPAARIVSLAPHLTEQLFAIGAGDRIVGTTEFADYPPPRSAFPRVGRAHSVDLERIARLKPDLIVIWGSGFPPGTVDAVRRLGTPVFVSEPRALDDVAVVDAAARRAHRPRRHTGRHGVSRQDRGAARALRRIGAPVRVFYQVWAAPLMTLSGRHVISEAIALCGGRNVFADSRTDRAAGLGRGGCRGRP